VTVAEIGRMSAREVEEWRYFEEEFGPLTVQERIDAMAAQVSYVAHASAGGKGKPEDFVPQWRAQRRMSITDWLHAKAMGA
jgi:hypothetical protein